MSEQEAQQTAETPSIYDHLAMMLQQMAHLAWSKLGLQHDSISGKIEQNLPEAKVAIDVVVYLAGIIDSELDDSDRRQIQSMVRDLRLNYVQKTTEATN